MYIAIVNARTADNVGLHVAATTYLDEYVIEPKKTDIGVFENTLNIDVLKGISQSKNLFDDMVSKEENILEILLNDLMKNATLKEAFMKGEREELYSISSDIFCITKMSMM